MSFPFGFKLSTNKFWTIVAWCFLIKEMEPFPKPHTQWLLKYVLKYRFCNNHNPSLATITFLQWNSRFKLRMLFCRALWEYEMKSACEGILWALEKVVVRNYLVPLQITSRIFISLYYKISLLIFIKIEFARVQDKQENPFYETNRSLSEAFVGFIIFIKITSIFKTV